MAPKAQKDLGKRFRCYECGTAFYDLNRPKPICPKCGADQSSAPKFEVPAEIKSSRVRDRVIYAVPEADAEEETAEFDEFGDIVAATDDDDIEYEEEED